MLVPFLDEHVFIAPSYVQFSEYLRPFDSVYKLWDEWKWVFVLNCPLIQASVVNYWAKLAILFLDKEEGGCVLGL